MMGIKKTADGLIFNVYVQPRASRSTIAGIYQDALKIKLTAPPVGGAANRQCCQVLAKSLGVAKSSIEIISGQSSRHKRIRIRSQNVKGKTEKVENLKSKLIRLAI